MAPWGANDTPSTKILAPASWHSAAISANGIYRSNHVGAVSYANQACARRQQRVQIVEPEQAVSGVREPGFNDCADIGQAGPGADIRLVILVGDDRPRLRQSAARAPPGREHRCSSSSRGRDESHPLQRSYSPPTKRCCDPWRRRPPSKRYIGSRVAPSCGQRSGLSLSMTWSGAMAAPAFSSNATRAVAGSRNCGNWARAKSTSKAVMPALPVAKILCATRRYSAR